MDDNYRELKVEEASIRFTSTLDNLGINFIYEEIEIPYIFDNTEHFYYPDFYLPDYNLLCEVHPDHRIDELMIAKKAANIKLGYKFKFITLDKLNDNPVEGGDING